MRGILVGGCARSGTTLTASLLASAPGAFWVPETPYKHEVFAALGSDPRELDLAQALRYFKRHFRYGTFMSQIDHDLDDAPSGPESYSDLLDWYFQRYAKALGLAQARIWVDHTTANILYTDTLLRLLPRAKMVHLVRDGRAVANSVMPLHFGPNAIHTTAYWWSKHIAAGLASEQRYPDRVIRVRYEDLVQEPEPTMRRLCSFLGLDYRPAMLSAEHTVINAPLLYNPLVGGRPDPRRLDRWQRLLPPWQVEVFEYLTCDLLALLGYEPVFGVKARRPSPARLAYLELCDKLAYPLNAIRKRHRFKRMFLKS